ncbi:MAG: hypothetical protein OCD02_03110 [Spirochaetaceae bacterium]
MNKEYERMFRILVKEFGKQRKMYIAMSSNDVPLVKIVTTYYWKGSFYLVTQVTSKITEQITKNKHVSICPSASFHKFMGEAVLIGHPLEDKNREIRDILVDVMPDWYFSSHDESDPKMCLIQIKINTAFTYANKIGYNYDFRTDELNSFKFTPNC